MRIVAIFHCWDDWYLLDHAIKNMRPLVDGIVVIGSTMSNYGEYSEIPERFKNEELFIREPQFHHALNNETEKRNYGLKIAREQGYTHFITCDSDEFYNPYDFNEAKKLFDDPELFGLICRCQTFFKKPTLTIGLDTTLVPFIHKLTPTIKHEFNRSYPFSWEGKAIRIDPSRSMNINSGVKMVEFAMFHYSWLRKDYQKKIRNSTAKSNLQGSTVLEDLEMAESGYFCKLYQKTLHTVPDYFNLGSIFYQQQ